MRPNPAIFSRAARFVAAALALFPLLAACDEDPGPEAVARGSEADQDEGDPEDSGGNAAPVSYPGTWQLQVDYPLDCEWGGFTEATHKEGTWTLKLEGSSDDLWVDIQSGWFHLAGAGSDESFFLNGTFPFDGYSGTALASPSDNSVSFQADTISKDTITGQVTGHFQDTQGWTCTHDGSTFVMTR